MQLPIVVGAIIAVICLVAFSGWGYHMVEGWRSFILDDDYFRYRILAASAISAVIVSATFLGMAYAFDCPNKDSDKRLRGLNCAEYRKIKARAEEVLVKTETNKANPSAQSEDEFVFDKKLK